MRYIAALILSLLPNTAFAEMSGNELRDYCSQDGTFSQGYCYGYIIGIADSHMYYEVKDGLMKRLFCWDGDVTLEQIVDVVRQYIEANPALRHEFAAILVLNALTEKFRCGTWEGLVPTDQP